jgi:hypothetical protein
MRRMNKQKWIVVAIAIALLAVAYIFVTTRVVHRDPANLTTVAFNYASAAIEIFRLDRDHYPAALQDLLGRSGSSGGTG